MCGVHSDHTAGCLAHHLYFACWVVSVFEKESKTVQRITEWKKSCSLCSGSGSVPTQLLPKAISSLMKWCTLELQPFSTYSHSDRMSFMLSYPPVTYLSNFFSPLAILRCGSSSIHSHSFRKIKTTTGDSPETGAKQGKMHQVLQSLLSCLQGCELVLGLTAMFRLVLCSDTSPAHPHPEDSYIRTSTKNIVAPPLGANVSFEQSCLVKCGLSWNPRERVMIEVDGKQKIGESGSALQGCISTQCSSTTSLE